MSSAFSVVCYGRHDFAGNRLRKAWRTQVFRKAESVFRKADSESFVPQVIRRPWIGHSAHWTRFANWLSLIGYYFPI